MDKVFVVTNSAAPQSEGKDSRQAWRKPEAKAADVANATLAGVTRNNPADLGTCAS